MFTKPRVITVTLNPAIDQTVLLEVLRPGEVNRCLSMDLQPGGKGVNVSAMLAGYGIPSAATGFLGAGNPGLFESLFASLGIRDAFIRLPGATRTGIKIVAGGETTDLNFPGLEPSAADLSKLGEMLTCHASPGSWVVFGGRLPAGVAPQDFALLIDKAKQAGARVAVDTSGEALRLAFEHGVDLVKPNHLELSEILGHALPDASSRLAAAVALQRRGMPHVILSQGAEGALFLAPDGRVSALPPPVRVTSTVGAGDSLLAGYLAGLLEERPLPERAALASVFAWCALENPRRQGPGQALAAERVKSIIVRPVSS